MDGHDHRLFWILSPYHMVALRNSISVDRRRREIINLERYDTKHMTAHFDF